MHKPVGPTSFSLVQQFHARARARTDRKPPRICHGGTLDPFAAGLLLILVEPATRLFDFLHDVPKVYDATIAWGAETDNGDPTGKVVAGGDPALASREKLDEVITQFVGWHEQVPPATSARRVDGERGYEKAHRAETVLLPPARVFLHEATWLEHDLPRTSILRLTVRGGFYVRSLVRDLGRRIGCTAHVAALHRRSIGPWIDPGPDGCVALRGRELLPWMRRRELSDDEIGQLRRGRAIEAGSLLTPDWPLPDGFPEPPRVRAFHLDHLRFILRPAGPSLVPIAQLGRGL